VCGIQFSHAMKCLYRLMMGRYICLLCCTYCNVILGTHKVVGKKWSSWGENGFLACEFQVTCKGCDWGSDPHASSVIDHTSVKIGVAKTNPATSEGAILAKNNMTLEGSQGMGRLRTGTHWCQSVLEYFSALSTS
jgi:hypothetical protein